MELGIFAPPEFNGDITSHENLLYLLQKWLVILHFVSLPTKRQIHLVSLHTKDRFGFNSYYIPLDLCYFEKF